jgi:transcriptional regulator with XRE-family HTH domain
MRDMSIHSRIRVGRLRLGLTEQQFADRLDVSRGSVHLWEKEGGTAPSRKRQAAVARLLGLSVAELLTGSNGPDSETPTIAVPLPAQDIPADLVLLVRWIDSIKNTKIRDDVIQQCMDVFLRQKREASK